MVEIRTEIEIAASPAQVWAVLVDFQNYVMWNPFMIQIAGTCAVGEKIVVEIKLPGSGRQMRVKEKVRSVTEHAELRWGGGPLIPGFADGEHFFQLIATDTGTRVLQGENFTGLLIPLLKRTIRRCAEGFELANAALKQRVEKGA